MVYKINKWFELNWGWLFINGRKQAAWGEYLRKKYSNDETKTKKEVMVKFPPKCLVCENDMDSLKINNPFCKECLSNLKELIYKKKKKNEKQKNS